MKLKALTLITVAVLGLSACKQQAETSVTSENAASTTQTPQQAANTVQTLDSSDNRIRIVIQGGQFTDISNDESARPDGVGKEELTLLQRDTTSDITIYVTNLGAVKNNGKTYFNNLKEALNKAEGISNVQVGAATENRMNYRFSQATEDGGELRENCIAIIESNNLFNVCANSQSATQEQLAGVLKDVNLIK
ncbi:cytochrome C [Neisseria sp. S1]|uniref:cytochrome C n=1 Tax=Neisseria sp. S1 TaxID=3318354 RepID=UPI003A888C48